MCGYYLSEGNSGSNSGYPNFLQSWNDWFERHLGRIVGDGWGVRNWFGPSEEGDWSSPMGTMDKYHIPLGCFLFLAVSLIMVDLWSKGDTSSVLVLVIYSFMVTLAVVIAAFNVNPKLPGEYLSAGNISDIKNYIKLVILVVSIWVILSLIASALSLQAISVISMGITTTFFISVILIPFSEASFLHGLFTAILARFFGIIPSSLSIGVITGIFHQYIFHFNLTQMTLSGIFAFMLCLLALKYKSKEPAIDAHILANFIAFVAKLL